MTSKTNPFSGLTYTQAERLIVPAKKAGSTTGAAVDVRALFDGDHWQDGRALPLANTGQSDKDWAKTLSVIARAQVSSNRIQEVTSRHLEAAMGLQPLVTIHIEGEEGEGGAEEKVRLESLARTWIQERGVFSVFEEALRTLLLGGKAHTRLLIPAGHLSEGGRITKRSIEEAWQLIYADHPQPDQATLVTDPDTRQRAGLYRGERGGNLSGKGAKPYIELCYLEGGKTTIKTLAKDQGSEESGGKEGGGKEQAASGIDLAGKLLLFELRRPALITPQVVQNQLAHNLALTMMQRNTSRGGFSREYLINLMGPGQWVQSEAGKEVFKPEPVPDGLGAIIPLQSQITQDADGNERATPGSVVRFEPVSAELFERQIEVTYRNILQETNQAHMLIIGDATTTGESRLQARAEFVRSLNRTCKELEVGMSALAHAALMLMFYVSTEDPPTGLRVQVQCRPNAGPLTSSERAALRADLEVGLISRRTAMLRYGIADIDAELAQIEAEAGDYQGAKRTLEIETSYGAAVRALIQADYTREEAVRRVMSRMGHAEEEITQEIARLSGEEPPKPEPTNA